MSEVPGSNKEVYNKIDREFTREAIELECLSPNEVETAITAQVETREAQGRCPRIWEILVLEEKITAEQSERILDIILKPSVEASNDVKISMVGRTLIDLGSTNQKVITSALELQAQERRNGTWRQLGQILLEGNHIDEDQLREALSILEEKRDQRKTDEGLQENAGQKGS